MNHSMYYYYNYAGIPTAGARAARDGAHGKRSIASARPPRLAAAAPQDSRHMREHVTVTW